VAGTLVSYLPAARGYGAVAQLQFELRLQQPTYIGYGIRTERGFARVRLLKIINQDSLD
jgi:hypothetical protein